LYKMSGVDIKDWYRSIPPITRAWFTAIVVIPLAGRFGILAGNYMFLNWDLFFSHCQIWRAVTCALYFPITPNTGFHYLITLYFIYNYSYLLEMGLFRGKPADYVFFLMFSWVSALIMALALGQSLLFDASMFVVLYLWCVVNKDQIVSFWFGTKFKAAYFPWVLLAFHMIISGSFMNELVGICAAHLYFFMKYKYPIDFGGRDMLQTPRFFYKYFPSTRQTGGFGGGQTLGRRNDVDPPQDQGRHNWGAGRRLDG